MWFYFKFEVKEINKLKSMNIPIFIPHNGCPNACVFCNQRQISGTSKAPTEEEVREILNEWVQEIEGKEEVEIAFFGGSFTGLPFEEQKQYLDIATEYVNTYHLKGIRMSTRPDYINPEVMEFLSVYPISAIELGVQSMSQNVLDATKRNHTVEDVYKGVQLIQQSGINLGLQMMIGLPEDTEEEAIRTAEKLILFKPSTIRIYPTIVIAGTELQDMYKRGEYKALSLQEAVVITGKILSLFEKAKITILRVGLQANEALDGNGYIAGPYHPAFKELVEDYIIYEAIVKVVIENKSWIKTIAGNHKIYQRLVGHKKENKQRLELLGISIRLDQSLQEDELLATGVNRRLVLPLVF